MAAGKESPHHWSRKRPFGCRAHWKLQRSLPCARNDFLPRRNFSALRCTCFSGLPGFRCGRSEEHTSELQSRLHLVCRLLLEKKKAVQNQNEPQLRDENANNDKSVHGLLNPTYQAGLRRDAVQPDIEAERKKRDEIEAGKSYCSRRFGGATCDDKSAQIYARFDKNDLRIQPAEFYRFHDPEVNTFGYF